jgi:hypothetical protein
VALVVLINQISALPNHTSRKIPLAIHKFQVFLTTWNFGQFCLGAHLRSIYDISFGPLPCNWAVTPRSLVSAGVSRPRIRATPPWATLATRHTNLRQRNGGVNRHLPQNLGNFALGVEYEGHGVHMLLLPSYTAFINLSAAFVLGFNWCPHGASY